MDDALASKSMRAAAENVPADFIDNIMKTMFAIRSIIPQIVFHQSPSPMKTRVARVTSMMKIVRNGLPALK